MNQFAPSLTITLIFISPADKFVKMNYYFLDNNFKKNFTSYHNLNNM